MTLPRSLKWIAGALLALAVAAVLLPVVCGWNWLRAPLERLATAKTGRVLAIQGDLKLEFAWPSPRLRSGAVTFANPDWAQEQQMVAADAVAITVDLSQLLRRNIVLPEVRLEHPVIFLEQGRDGRRNWLLDQNQQDEDAIIHIGRLLLDQGTVGYDDAAKKTRIRATLSTTTTAPGDGGDPGVTFAAQGQYQGLALKASGSGGPVLALRDESAPYAMKIAATLGRTGVRADGTVTSLVKLSAVDMQLALSGDSLDQLYPLLGIALPATRAYAASGHLWHGGKTWRFEKFTGRIGASDIAGSIEVDSGGARQNMKGELTSTLLDLADLAPLIGARPVPAPTAAVPAAARVLPELPFRTERWPSVDADVTLKAKTIRRAKELPLEDLVAHLRLHDAVLTLDPLDFGVAGGRLSSVIVLDGRKDPIQAHAQVRAKKMLMAKLFPTIELNRTSIGEVNGEFDLVGQGNSVGRMLGSADGKMQLVVAGGAVSKLMMEKVGLHLWEILALKVTGDRQVKLRCAVADFDVKHGVMHTDALIFDTEITTIVGSGSIDLAHETLALTLNQKTKNTSPLALRSPIYIGGSFSHPTAAVDKGRAALRAFGALALGVVNPLLALIPLVDAGPGKDADCGELVREARAQRR